MSPELIKSLSDENKFLKSEVDRLKGMIIEMRRDRFGPRSETIREINNQQPLFNEIEVEAPKAPPDKETITYTRRKGRKKKRPIPEGVEREDVVIDLPEEEKRCPHDGSPLKEIGEAVSKKVKTMPARVVLVTERKKKYACPVCQSHVAEARVPSILPGTIATPELLAFIVFSKFFQALPLYRMEEFFKLQGIEIKRSTMARWLVQAAEKLMPIWNLLEEKVLQSGYMAIDATGVQVLKELGRRPQSKSFMWCRGSPEKGIALFDYDVSGAGMVAKRLTEGFSGALQADAHRGYRVLDPNSLLLLGCMMHARRRFHKAWLKAKKKPGIAAEALKGFRFLYEKEEDYKKRKLTPQERQEWRDKEIRPSLEELKKWFEYHKKEVAPSSDLGNALNYFVLEYKRLSAFLQNGRYEMDNGWIERIIRRFAIGRKNWIFSQSVEGAKASALLYSLTLTAKLNGKDPFTVMTEIFRKLPLATTIDDYETLTQLLLSPDQPNSCLKKEGALIH